MISHKIIKDIQLPKGPVFLARWAVLALLILCSCATAKVPPPAIPQPAAINSSAGCSDNLFVNLHLADGKELLFAVDTGSPWTILDKSLEPQLGKRSFGKRWLRLGWFPDIWANVYHAPPLYLGETPLAMNPSVPTCDLRRFMPKYLKVDGILGMDCLRHYCVQLDFGAQEIRFLDPKNLSAVDLGKRFPLSYPWGDLSTRMDFVGKTLTFGVDTGDFHDGTLKTSVLSRLKRAAVPAKMTQGKTESGATERLFYFPELRVGGGTYTNLLIHKQSDGINANILGLQFLARHLVTFDFPHETMYLRQTSVGPLEDHDLPSLIVCIKDLGKRGLLPGVSKGDKGTMFQEPIPGRKTLIFKRANDDSFRHYQFAKTSDAGSWKLAKAWRTSENGKVIEEYPIP